MARPAGRTQLTQNDIYKITDDIVCEHAGTFFSQNNLQK